MAGKLEGDGVVYIFGKEHLDQHIVAGHGEADGLLIACGVTGGFGLEGEGFIGAAGGIPPVVESHLQDHIVSVAGHVQSHLPSLRHTALNGEVAASLAVEDYTVLHRGAIGVPQPGAVIRASGAVGVNGQTGVKAVSLLIGNGDFHVGSRHGKGIHTLFVHRRSHAHRVARQGPCLHPGFIVHVGTDPDGNSLTHDGSYRPGAGALIVVSDGGGVAAHAVGVHRSEVGAEGIVGIRIGCDGKLHRHHHVAGGHNKFILLGVPHRAGATGAGVGHICRRTVVLGYGHLHGAVAGHGELQRDAVPLVQAGEHSVGAQGLVARVRRGIEHGGIAAAGGVEVEPGVIGAVRGILARENVQVPLKGKHLLEVVARRACDTLPGAKGGSAVFLSVGRVAILAAAHGEDRSVPREPEADLGLRVHRLEHEGEHHHIISGSVGIAGDIREAVGGGIAPVGSLFQGDVEHVPAAIHAGQRGALLGIGLCDHIHLGNGLDDVIIGVIPLVGTLRAQVVLFQGRLVVGACIGLHKGAVVVEAQLQAVKPPAVLGELHEGHLIHAHTHPEDLAYVAVSSVFLPVAAALLLALVGLGGGDGGARGRGHGVVTQKVDVQGGPVGVCRGGLRGSGGGFRRADAALFGRSREGCARRSQQGERHRHGQGQGPDSAQHVFHFQHSIFLKVQRVSFYLAAQPSAPALTPGFTARRMAS